MAYWKKKLKIKYEKDDKVEFQSSSLGNFSVIKEPPHIIFEAKRTIPGSELVTILTVGKDYDFSFDTIGIDNPYTHDVFDVIKWRVIEPDWGAVVYLREEDRKPWSMSTGALGRIKQTQRFVIYTPIEQLDPQLQSLFLNEELFEVITE